MTIQLTTRNADLSDLAELLKAQQAAKVDYVAPFAGISSTNGVLTVAGTSVFGEGSQFIPTEIADGQLADKLGIPVQYLRRLRAERPDLYDANINGWTRGAEVLDDTENQVAYYAPDAREGLLRTFQGEVGEPGILRAVLSDRFAIIDNLDALMAVLAGVKDADTPIQVLGADLTETRMTVRLAAPEIFVNSPQLLEGYRSPFSGTNHVPQWAQDKFGVDADGVFAGLVISNSETGGGSFLVAPRFMVLKCTNGMMIKKDALRQVHLGGKLQTGNVAWAEDTQRTSLELVTKQARDAVKAFLNPEYVRNTLDDIAGKAAKAIENPAEAIKVIAKTLAFTQAQSDGILDHFIKGGQVTAGGFLQAVTSYSQTVENADVAYDLESNALRVLEVAAAL